jgi:hypothetical protein
MRTIDIGREAPAFAEPLLTLNGLNLFEGWQDRITTLKEAVDPITLGYEHVPELPRIGLIIDHCFDEVQPPVYSPYEFLDQDERTTAVVLRFADEIVAGRDYDKSTLKSAGRLIFNFGNLSIHQYLEVPKDAIPLFGQQQRDTQNEAVLALKPIANRRNKKRIIEVLGSTPLGNRDAQIGAL